MKTISFEDVLEMDERDPLAPLRDQFSLPEGVIYLDGNSLGAIPRDTPRHLAQVVEDEWGRDLIRSWNSHDWIGMPQRIGAKIAGLVGAGPDEVIACDSTSVNLFKLLQGAIALQSSRGTILTENAGFPTDRYMAQSVADLCGSKTVKAVERDAIIDMIDANTAVLLLTHVDYRSGHKLDMARVNAAAKEKGALVVWDLSHSAGAVELDLAGSGSDLAVGGGYKYLNGGPGAPAFLYVRREMQDRLANPLPGWLGHAKPFAFSQEYEAASGIDRFLCGTPPVLAMAALESGLAQFEGVDLAALFAKGQALCELYVGLMAKLVDRHGFTLASPSDGTNRGSHVSYAHPQAFAICQALISRGVIGDFRTPDLLRMGFTPLYTRYRDVWDAVRILEEVMDRELWSDERFSQKQRVT
ncbi:kynureninase [Croceicoccus gelatinilyticus]|uniref:kynureninase n=1 Tax=Croceicoccus gelatinilyticus TaxID=2835536 RepID=UPI001BCED415|nr:kynureninase [Croceicoccus gelatinilyticus]MBS7668579.1 kynureninase [Croceicoccus gelatinilyticus]